MKMAEDKKVAATAKPVEKAAAKPVAKAAPVKKEAAAKKETVKKEVVKKETAKKEVVKKPAAKVAVKELVKVEFAGKSYTNEDFVKIAKDVWVYDLQKEASQMKSLELYVKPEEALVYYVVNGEITGSFAI